MEVMQTLQPLTGEKAHLNVEVEGTRLRTMATRIYREIRVEGKSANFVILATSTTTTTKKEAERTEAAKSTEVWLVIQKTRTSFPKGNQADVSFENVTRSK